MSESLWVGILLLASWASLPIIMVYANSVFDHDVVRDGEEPGQH